MRQLFKFLYAEGHRADDPAAVLEGPKRGRTLPKVLSIKDVERLLDAARAGMNDESAKPAQRLRAARMSCLLETLYATGLRVSELIALPATAARTKQAMLVIRGKGGKERLVPLNDTARRAMTDYLKLAGKSETKWLFPSFGESGHMTRQHFARELKTLAAIMRHRVCKDQPACPAARLCQPPAAQRRRSPRRADAARPCRYLNDANLYARAGRPAEEPGPRSASARRR